jgi:hypothetical protein
LPPTDHDKLLGETHEENNDEEEVEDEESRNRKRWFDGTFWIEEN